MRRCFIALAVPIATRARLARVQQTLAACASREDLSMTLTRPENLHLTLKFLGATTEADLLALERALHEVASAHRPFSATLAGLGAFPTVDRARAVFARVSTGSEQLAVVASALEDAAVRLGFAAESRARVPHVTLARIRKPRASARLATLLDTWPLDRLGEIDTTQLVLFETVSGSNGSHYAPLINAPLHADRGASR